MNASNVFWTSSLLIVEVCGSRLRCLDLSDFIDWLALQEPFGTCFLQAEDFFDPHGISAGQQYASGDQRSGKQLTSPEYAGLDGCLRDIQRSANLRNR